MRERLLSRMPPLRALAAFEAVARNRSFSRAAAELNVSVSAVSQQVKILEAFLATNLFKRLNRRVLLTEAGELYFAAISASFEAMADATESVNRHRSPQMLVVRAAPTLATKWLMPRLSTFLAACPELDLRLDASNEKTDFLRDAVDLELRFGKEGCAGLFVEPLCRETFVPLATPAFVERHGVERPEDLLRVPLIHSVKAPSDWPTWFAANGLRAPARLRGTHFDRSYMAIDAALDGMGVALESRLAADADLASGRLVSPVASRQSFVHILYWFVCPFEKLEREAVQRFRAWLRSHPEMLHAGEPSPPEGREPPTSAGPAGTAPGQGPA